MKNEIWKWFDSDYKVHCQRREDYDKIMSWKKSRPGGVYYIPGAPNEYDVIVPEEYVKRTAELLGLSKKSRGKSSTERQRVTESEIAVERRSPDGMTGRTSK